MRAVLIHETGDPEVLRYEETERPEPDDGQVLLRVHAASVNPADWKARRGFMDTPLPAVLGYDASGTSSFRARMGSTRATRCLAGWRAAPTPSLRPHPPARSRRSRPD